MPVLGIVLLLVGSVVTLAVLAVVLVLATDRLRSTVDQVLAVRGQVQPALDDLQRDAAAARAHATRIQNTRRRPDGATPNSD